MLQLLGADFCRDGGSIVMEYRKEDGSLVSVLLEVTHIPDHGKPREFGHLHVGSEIQNRCDTSTIVPRGSEAERLLLADIDELLRRGTYPKLLPDSLYHVRDLREQLLGRSG